MLLARRYFQAIELISSDDTERKARRSGQAAEVAGGSSNEGRWILEMLTHTHKRLLGSLISLSRASKGVENLRREYPHPIEQSQGS